MVKTRTEILKCASPGAIKAYAQRRRTVRVCTHIPKKPKELVNPKAREAKTANEPTPLHHGVARAMADAAKARQEAKWLLILNYYAKITSKANATRANRAPGTTMAHAISTKKATATAAPIAYSRIMTLLHQQQRRQPQQPPKTSRLNLRAKPQNKRL